MSGYQRMISYLYRYENHIKTANTGYARIEQRNGKCRITISLQDLLASPPEAALFIQQEEYLLLIPAGKLLRKGNSFGLRIETPIEKILGTSYDFSNIDGIFLSTSNEVFYATTWKELQIQAQKILTYGQIPASEQIPTFGQTESQIPTSGQTEGQIPASGQAEGQIPASGQAGGQIPASGRAGEWGDVSQAAHGPGPSTDTLSATLASQTALENKWHTPLKPDLNQLLDRSIELEGQSLESKHSEPFPTTQYEPDLEWNEWHTMGYTSKQNNNPSDDLETGQKMDSTDDPDFGQKIISMFPKMYPFDIDNMEECVRLDLKDIGYLPVQHWSLAGNPFLLHGYFCYRHLIFTRLPNGEYVIGVPGIYNDTNRLNAEECGFTDFQALTEVPDLQNAFGYWIYSIEE